MEWRANSIKTFRKSAVSLGGDPVITTMIVNDCFLRDTKHVNPIPYPRRYSKLINDQNHIGWDQVLCGRVTKTFVQHHDLYSKLNRTSTNGEQWNNNENWK